MTYAKDNPISTSHFNAFAGQTAVAAADAATAQNKAGYLWGVGYGDRGYGQMTPALVPKAALDPIGQEWNTLRSVMASLASWQGTEASLLPAASAFIAGTSVASHQRATKPQHPSDIGAMLQLLDANRLNYKLQNMSYVVGLTDTKSSAWSESASSTGRFVFKTEDEARYFFNTGGELRLAMNHAPNSDLQDANWNQVLSNLAFSVKAHSSQKISGSGTATSTAIGYYELTPSWQTVVNGANVGSSYYSDNDYLVEARTRQTSFSRGGKGHEIEVRVTLIDEHVNIDYDSVSAGTQVVFGYLKPASELTVAAPTVKLAVSFDGVVAQDVTQFSTGLATGLTDYFPMDGSGINEVNVTRSAHLPPYRGFDLKSSWGTATSSNVVLTQQTTGLRYSSQSVDPWISFTGTPFPFAGSGNRYVHLRYKRISGGSSNIQIYYTTNAHGPSEPFSLTVPEPVAANTLGTAVDVVIDMGTLPDWLNNNINGVRLDLGSSTNLVYEIEHLYFSNSATLLNTHIPYQTEVGAMYKQAAQFNSASSLYGVLPNAVGPTSTFTMSVWATGTGAIFHKGTDAGGGGWGIGISDTATALACSLVTASPQAAFTATVNHGAATTSTLRHYLIEFDGAAKTLQVTVNNAATNVTSTGTGSTIRGVSPVLIGASQYGTPVTDHRNGTLDEMAIWNRILTPAEKAELYNSGVGSVRLLS